MYKLDQENVRLTIQGRTIGICKHLVLVYVCYCICIYKDYKTEQLQKHT